MAISPNEVSLPSLLDRVCDVSGRGFCHPTQGEEPIRFLTVISVCACVVAAPALAASMNARQLSDAHVGSSRQELIEQRSFSRAVISRLAGSWKVAPRHSTCWTGVPWAKVCDRARQRLLAHRWLYGVAERRWKALYKPVSRPQSVPAVICAVFGSACGEALSVARCESGYSVTATNGQYFGVFQMGSGERARFGGSSLDPWDQVRAAFAYFRLSGWGPWECA